MGQVTARRWPGRTSAPDRAGEPAMTPNTTNAEETDEYSEREMKIVRSIPIDVPITEEVMEHARKRNEERPGGVLEDYILECVDLSVSVENAPT